MQFPVTVTSGIRAYKIRQPSRIKPMANQNLIGPAGSGRSSSKAKIILVVIIFIAGIIAGVVGLCVALKVIFYIGLVVALAAAVAIVVGIIALKRRLDDDDDRPD